MACKEFKYTQSTLCNTLSVSDLQQAAISVEESGNSLPFIYYVMPLCHGFRIFFGKKSSNHLFLSETLYAASLPSENAVLVLYFDASSLHVL